MAAGQTKLNIVISAVDNATKTVQKINKQLAQLTRPMTQLNRSFKQFSNVSGLTKVGSALGGVGRAAVKVGQQIAGAATKLGSFVGAGSIGAIIAMAAEWGKLGFQIAQTANVLGVSTFQLQQFRAAATMSGLGADAATAAIKAMGDTLEDATYGRNAQALAMMRQLGIQMHRTAGGAVDSHRALLDLADALNDPRFRGNRQAQAFAARAFGAESMLPLLLQGRKAIQAYEAESLRTGQTRDTGAAAGFGAVLYRAEGAAQGLRNTIGDKLIPVLTPLLEQFIRWEIANKDIIGTRIAEFVQKFVDVVPKAIKGANDIANALGGWKNVAIGLGVVMTANVLAPTLGLMGALGKLTITTIPAAVRALALLGTSMGAVGGLGTTVAAGATSLGLLGVAGAVGYGAGMGFNWLYGKGSSWLGGSGALGSDLAGFSDHSADAHNPGNLRNPGGKGFQSFATEQLGVDAMASQLRRYGNRGISSIADLVNTYSPASDGNDPATEIPQIASWSGLSSSKKIDLNDADQLAALMSAIIRKEGHSDDVTPEMIKHAVQVTVHIHAPHGTQARVEGAGNVKTVRSMSPVAGG